jgi:hypothetical protein
MRRSQRYSRLSKFAAQLVALLAYFAHKSQSRSSHRHYFLRTVFFFLIGFPIGRALRGALFAAGEALS